MKGKKVADFLFSKPTIFHFFVCEITNAAVFRQDDKKI